MADNVEIQGIEFQIVNDSTAASEGLDKLAKSLANLKTALGGSCTSLSRAASSISQIKNALKNINSGDFESKLKRISSGLEMLGSKASSLKISSSIGNQLSAISIALDNLKWTDGDKLTALADGLRPLTELGKANLNSFLTQLSKLPGIIGQLEKADIEKFSKQMKELAAAITPFANEMNKVSNGFAAFPSRIQRLIRSTEQYNDTVTKSTKKNRGWANSFNLIKGVSFIGILKIVSNALSSAITKASEYQETLNLFTVSMKEYGEEAYAYAEKVSEIMGIDPADWMKNQGVFNTIITGFGVAGDKAAYMSKNLTQLAYDLSSFYNISFAESMQKVQSGIAGELEPLRRLGYDLSVARLEQERLNLGIDKSVSSMTQAEKSQLRYYAMLTQVTEAQGDMARTLEQPANMMRVLKAQIEQASRALGNIFIPILTKVLPVAIAVAKGIREIIASIAALFGVEMQEIDWNSSIESAADVTGDISDNMDSAAGSAKELKRYLAGFDELNVLPDQSSGGAGGGASASVGGDLGINLPGYDFLGDAVSKNVDKVYKKLKKVIDPIKKILNYLYEYRSIVIAGLGVAAIVTLWKKAKKAWSWFKGLSLVSTFLSGFKTIKDNGGGVFSSINGGISAVRDSLSGIQKAAIVAAAGFAEFTTVRQNVKDLATGCEDAGSKIAGIGIAATVAGAAMYVALGPYGLALAAVVGLTAALIGFNDAQEEMRREIVDAEFFDGVGISLDTFRTKLELLTEKFNLQNQQICDWREEIEANNETIDKIGSKIQTLTATLGSTGTVTQEEIDKIKGQFNSLYECIRENMTLSEEVILTALVGAMQRATPEISEQIDLLIGEYQRYVRETQGRAEELKMLIDNAYDNLIGKEKDDPAYQEIMRNILAWQEELGYLAGGMSDAGWQWQQTVNDFNNNEIDFGTSVEDVTNTLSEIATCGQTALEDLAVARDTVLKRIDEQIAYAARYGSPEEVEFLGDIRQIIEDDYAAQEEDIKSELNTIFESIQEGMIGKISDTKEALEDEWDDMNWFEHWWYDDNEEKYVFLGLQDMQGQIDTISTAIQGHMDDLETNGSAWASDAMRGITDALFDYDIGLNGQHNQTMQYSYAMDLEDAIEQVFSELEESGKKASTAAGEEITNGISTGISDAAAVDAVTGSAVDVVDAADQAVRDAADINSPSKLFATEGGHMMDGLIEGIEDKLSALKDTLTSVVQSAFDTDEAWDYGYDYGWSFAKGLVKAIKNTSFPTIKGTVATSGSSASISFKAYADGGFVDAGQLFVAREAGAEMVGSIGRRTAVANNDQIVEAVSSGVYKAVVAAMSNRTPDHGKGQTVTAKVNDKTLFEVIVDYARNETVRTGSNPLLEF